MGFQLDFIGTYPCCTELALAGYVLPTHVTEGHMFYQFDWSAIFYPELWLGALWVTFAYAVFSIVGGLLIGLVFGVAMLSKSKIIRIVVGVYVQVFRCTPLLVQIVWFFYALPMLTGMQLSAWFAAGLGLTLYMGAFCTEIFRAGVMSIERGQWQAAMALGMRYREMMVNIILPQAFRRMLPPVVSQSILQLKNTSLLYVVAVPDLMYTASVVTSTTYRPLEAYTFVALIYLVILYPLTAFSKRLEARNDI